MIHRTIRKFFNVGILYGTSNREYHGEYMEMLF